MKIIFRRCTAITALFALLTGCAHFREEHYFSSTDVSGSVTNYFRLRIGGTTSFGRARYVAGYYDERAVDLFFNEVKRTGNDADDVKPIFNTGLMDPGSTDTIKPLLPDPQHGAFLMILSNNPKAVTDVIGNFAESQQVADAITNLVNRPQVAELRKLNAEATVHTGRMSAVSVELQSLFGAIPSDAHPNQSQTENGYLRILNSIAGSLGSTQSFKSLDDPALAVWLEQARHAETPR